MELRRCRLTDPEVEPLLAGLHDEYHARYGPNDELSRAAVDEFDPPYGAFMVAVDDGMTVAGGGFRPLEPGVCEVKRMWTHPDHRRRGLAMLVLGGLEDAARQAGYRAIRLETGPAQPEAQALYARAGYHRVPTFGSYRDALAFERVLSQGEGAATVES
jgi:polar amino acid transport system permease protein